MAISLADALRQTGYSQDGELAVPASVEPTMTSILQKHIASLPQQLATNQQAMDNTMASMYKTDMATGQPNPNYRPEAMQEFTQLMPNMVGSTAIFHGTSPESAANIAKRGFNVKKSADGSIWFTTNPDIGEVAATGKGAVVKRLIDENKMKLATSEQADKYFTDQLIAEGYQGVKYPDMTSGTHYQIFNPEKLGKEKISRKQLLEEQLSKKSVE